MLLSMIEVLGDEKNDVASPSVSFPRVPSLLVSSPPITASRKDSSTRINSPVPPSRPYMNDEDFL